MKILVVGSEGFIGKHTCQYFAGRADTECWGCDVVTGYDKEQYFLLDATNSDFNQIFEKYTFDVCINCSGAASVPDSFLHPLRDYMLNAVNVAKMLEAIRRYQPGCRFINLSSAAVYGNPAQLPIRETDPCQPLSPYGNHKLMAEKLCKEYHHFYNIPTCSVRIFSAYGPGLKKQLLWDIYQKSLLGDIIDLSGTGNETRDFIYIDDIVSGIESIIYKSDFKSNIYNLANGLEITISEVAECFLLLLGSNIQHRFSGETRKGDPVRWRADISRLSEIGFKPKYSFEKGVANYVDWLLSKNF